jgi:hypothetical protein
MTTTETWRRRKMATDFNWTELYGKFAQLDGEGNAILTDDPGPDANFCIIGEPWVCRREAPGAIELPCINCGLGVGISLRSQEFLQVRPHRMIFCLDCAISVAEEEDKHEG